MNGQVFAIAAILMMAYFAGLGVWDGVKWVGKEAKKGGTAIVHALKKIPHPSHHKKDDGQ